MGKGKWDLSQFHTLSILKIYSLTSKEIIDKFRSLILTNVLNRKYKENNFIIKSSMEIDKSVKLWTSEVLKKGDIL